MDDHNTDTTPSIFYKKDTYYSVTINPEDKFQYMGTADRFKRFRSLMYELFISLSAQHISYKFRIELSEPRTNKFGSGPRYHVHGWILFKSNHSIWQFLDNTFYRWTRIGHVDIDSIEDLDKWEKYMSKQSHIFKVSPILSSDHDKLFVKEGVGDSSPELSSEAS